MYRAHLPIRRYATEGQHTSLCSGAIGFATLAAIVSLAPGVAFRIGSFGSLRQPRRLLKAAGRADVGSLIARHLGVQECGRVAHRFHALIKIGGEQVPDVEHARPDLQRRANPIIAKVFGEANRVA